MLKKHWKKLGITAGLALMLTAAGCGGSNENQSVSEQLDHTITGIEPGAGVMSAAEKAVDSYDSLKGWEVEPSSSGAMASALGDAINNKEPIIVTGWTPHWMFAKYDLKYLKDPKKAFGDAEEIHTITRKGFESDNPGANKILDQFNWKVSDMESVMLEINNGTEPAKAAKEWVDKHSDKVAEWTKGAEKGKGQKVNLVYVEWDSEIASTHVMQAVLESQGYKVNVTPIDNAVMWQSVAQGEADAMVAAWLPATHGDLYAQYKGQINDLGANLTGAKIGLAVPSYMNVDSIEDLEAK